MRLYETLKTVHVACVFLSGVGFAVRGAWMLRGDPRLGGRLARVAPHVVDSLLLASASGLAFTLRQYPFVAPWLTAKVLGLLVYIALGTVALKRGRTKGIRTAAFVAALLTYGWIVSVAFRHDPHGLLAP